MTDDILTRLREQVDNHFCYYDGEKCADCRNANAAADEIERSWVEWSLWKMTAEQLARELGKVSYAETTYEDTKKAWNG
jgi:hypothetical protein